jgi:hypothetical protein
MRSRAERMNNGVWFYVAAMGWGWFLARFVRNWIGG